MGRIVVRFEGLCVLFKNLKKIESVPPIPSLTVGLVEVTRKTQRQLGSPVEVKDGDIHIPRITIFEIQTTPTFKRKWVKQYEKEVAGDLVLAPKLLTMAPKLSTFTSTSDVTLSKIIAENDNQNVSPPKTFKVINVSNDLYPLDIPKPQAKPELCKARLHIRTGTLYSMQKKAIAYGVSDMEGIPLSGEGAPVAKTGIAIKAGLEMFVPDGRYAQLKFSDDTPAFKFNGKKSYEVIVSSLSKNSDPTDDPEDRNHFLYYYSVFSPKPSKLKAPVGVVPAPFNNPFCSVIGGGDGGGG